MMLRNLLYDNRGVALILTIMVVSFVIALSLEFNREMRTQVAAAGNVGQGLKAFYVAKSGVSYGLAVLAQDPPESDSFRDAWAEKKDLTARANTAAGMLGGSVELEINDLSGRIPINLLVDSDKVKDVFKRLLGQERFGLESDTINTIVDSTMDWIDSADQEDDFHRLYGAEDDYYQSLNPPYHCKNGPMDTPEELLLVKGVTRELFFGTEGNPGLREYITVYGDDKSRINMNTAPAPVLEALCNDYDGETLAGLREDATDAELESGQWYKDKIVKDFDALAATTSNRFQLVCSGRYGDAVRQVLAVVERNPDNKDIQTLAWKIN